MSKALRGSFETARLAIMATLPDGLWGLDLRRVGALPRFIDDATGDLEEFTVE